MTPAPTIRALLVEDSRTDALLLREMLADLSEPSTVVTHVQRLSEAKARLASEPFDIVLLDLGLPDSTGLLGLTELQATRSDAPVIVLTGTDDDEMGPAAMRGGAQDFVRKHELHPLLIGRAIQYAIERHRVQRERRDNQAHLSGIIASAVDGIISVDHELRLLLVNPAAARMFARSVGDLIGQPLEGLVPDAKTVLLPAAVREPAGTALSKPPSNFAAISGVRGNGDRFPIEASVSQATVNGRTFFTAILRDVTERRRVETSLRESELTYRTLFDSLVDGVCVGQDHRFVFTNPALPKMLGYEHADFLGARFEDVVAPDFLDLWNDRFRKRVGRGPDPTGHYEARLLRRDGQPLWTDVRATRVQWKGRPAVLGIVRDISERRALDDRAGLRQGPGDPPGGAA